MKKIIVAFVLLIGVTGFAQTSKEAKIKELIEVTGVSKMAVQGAQQFVNTYKENYKDIPDEFWNGFLKEVSTEEFSKLYIPIYSKYYTESDLDELIKFYKTPIGQKTISNMPLIMNESMEVGREWGQNLAKKLIDKINEQKGYQSPPPPKSK
ncbi:MULTISPECIES: DUF2059 domain-containing protein [Chryseobacterium]|uniref:DUF2059 domain-containing protein n=1 Tax=Chryseobacterium gambrini TaxID=373672 RepID=A0A1N7QYT1_9FLAO|nr:MULTISPECIES: DUF2059 domain-containing protein [Chryseobacterium]MCQ4142379.1 DUF2059 domain-containing protein [Chryseobacterium sp. EO14]SIT28000.1 hypothetical protein SAMN05421785_12413 [Chryseobacterium gambrini]